MPQPPLSPPSHHDALLASALDAIGGGLLIVAGTPDPTIQHATAAFARVAGRPVSALIGRPLSHILTLSGSGLPAPGTAEAVRQTARLNRPDGSQPEIVLTLLRLPAADACGDALLLTLAEAGEAPPPRIAWSELFRTGIDWIDAQHRELIALANQIETTGNSVPLAERIAALAEHSRRHFADEEAWMAEQGGIAPERIAAHSAGHRHFLRQLELLEGARIDPRAQYGFLGSWLIHHLLHEDRALLASPGDDASRPANAGGTDDEALLVAAIGRLYDSLTGVNDELERAVASRTAELRTTNQQLEAEKSALHDTLDQLRATQLRLLHSEKLAAVGQLAAGVAHEINNPIGFVKSNLGALAGYVDELFLTIDAFRSCEARAARPDADAAHLAAVLAAHELTFLREDCTALLQESGEGLDRIQRIVSDLRNFSHVSEPDWRITDLHRELDGTLAVLGYKLRQKAEVIRAYGPLPPLYCNPGELNQVFVSLLMNAAQAITTHGQITVRTGASDGWGWIEVSDTGCGIAPGELPRVFDPFYTTRPVGEGTGLGLALAWSIIRNHGGDIAVDSTPGVGTTFRLRLPLATAMRAC